MDLTGTVTLTTAKIDVAANVTAGGAVALTNTGPLRFLAGVTVAADAGAVTQAGGGGVVLATAGTVTLQSAQSKVTVADAVEAATDGVGALVLTAANPTAGLVQLDSSVGAGKRPASLSVTAGLQAKLGGATYRTTAGQTFQAKTEVSAATVSLDAGAGKLLFTAGSTLDAAAPGGSKVTLASATEVSLGGAVGGLAPLNSLTVNAGLATVGGGLVRTTTDQTYNAPVALTADATFQATAAGAITFDQTLTGASKAATVASNQAVVLNGAVSVGTLDVTGTGDTTIAGGAVTATTLQRYAARCCWPPTRRSQGTARSSTGWTRSATVATRSGRRSTRASSSSRRTWAPASRSCRPGRSARWRT